MTTTIAMRPADLGHDGKCDHDGGCTAPATLVMLSAAKPDCACGTCGKDRPSASLAFLCAEHIAAEQIADLQVAERLAADYMDGPAGSAWCTLLRRYPQPAALSDAAMPACPSCRQSLHQEVDEEHGTVLLCLNPACPYDK